MSFFPDTDTFAELVAICSDGATVEHRAEATRLLASELVARLKISDRNHNPVPEGVGWNWHPAWDHLNAENGGPEVADFYRTRGALMRHLWIGSVPQEPRPQAEYDLTLIAVEQAAATLVAEAETAMGSALFLASQSDGVARARLLYTATAGNRHDVVQARVPGGWSVGGFDLVVPTTGSYYIDFVGEIVSTDPDPNALIPLELAINGIATSTLYRPRSSKVWDNLTPSVTDPAFYVVSPLLRSLTGGDAIEVRNGSGTYDHTIQGRIRIWSAGVS